MAQAAKNPAMQKMWVRSVSQEGPWVGNGTHSSILTFRSPWFLESGRSPGVGNGTSSILAKETHGQRSQMGFNPFGLEELDMTPTKPPSVVRKACP